MCTDDAPDKESIARDLEWESYDAAPLPVQNNIDAVLAGPFVEDPFAQLRRDE